MNKPYAITFLNPTIGSQWVAKQISIEIKQKQAANQTCILGLATGSSPIAVYKELIKLHQEEGLSFKNVITFNLDEYFPIKPNQNQSYTNFMNKHLFNHIDIPKKNINIPNGNIALEEVAKYCQQYEQKIIKLGGIDIQLLGIGRTGHIGFNEPGSKIDSTTRLTHLNQLTISDASPDFKLEKDVPKKAITMGINTILSSKRILLMAWGAKKSSIVHKAIEGQLTDLIPATYLQIHKNTEFILDFEAAKKLHYPNEFSPIL